MNVSLTPLIEQYIKDRVSTGVYGNASEVVREAIRLMMREDAEREARLEALRTAIAAGEDDVAAGRTMTLDSDADVDQFFEAL